ncbi:MAG: nucleotidyltransferase family protein [Candidatus Zixiibacteriota bacterium]|nr:MAG: nucleotidyltransferase family protein [candidate division Zixibacteria bacterium]
MPDSQSEHTGGLSSEIVVGAVILAAGASRRLNRAKQLLEIDGRPLVLHAVDCALASKCGDVVVVLGANRDEIAKVVAPTGATVVYNKNWSEGKASSIRCGLETLIKNNREMTAAIIMTCDQPYVSAAHLDRLIATHLSHHAAIVASAYAGTRGIPALFAKELFPQLLSLTGESGAKEIILSHEEKAQAVAFPRGEVDIDTWQDFTRLRPNK